MSDSPLSSMILDSGPATVPSGWGGAGHRLCYVQVPPGPFRRACAWGRAGETTKRGNPDDLRRQGDQMRRRELLLLVSVAMTAAGGLRAQQKAMPVVGFLWAGSPGAEAAHLAAFRQGLSETGYVEGQT